MEQLNMDKVDADNGWVTLDNMPEGLTPAGCHNAAMLLGVKVMVEALGDFESPQVDKKIAQLVKLGEQMMSLRGTPQMATHAGTPQGQIDALNLIVSLVAMVQNLKDVVKDQDALLGQISEVMMAEFPPTQSETQH